MDNVPNIALGGNVQEIIRPPGETGSAATTDKIAQVVVGLPLEGPFDYVVSPELREKVFVGCRVAVPFGHRRLQGIIVGFEAKSAFSNLKPLFAGLDPYPLVDAAMLELTKNISEHYGCSWGEALEAALPDLLRKGKFFEREDVSQTPADAEKISRERQPGLNILSQEKTSSSENATWTLIHDPSRTQSWPMILEQIQQVISQRKGIIFLVPETVMIDAIESRLKEALKIPVFVLDKNLTPRQELKEWIAIQDTQPALVVGSRSAVFAPVKALGMIVVYDEDNAAYKQEQVPYYHAREVAMMRSSIEKADVLFVSAIPSLEAWHLVLKKKARLTAFAAQPSSEVIPVDLTNYHEKKTSLVSFPLRNHMEKTLNSGGKVVLLMNRKGFSLLTRCHACGYSFKCQRCDVNLSYSYAKKKLVCRHCRAVTAFPSRCPKCQNTKLRSIGTGIEKLESEMARVFPQYRTQRYDRDSAQAPKNFDILIATQAVLRVRDKIPVQLVGCLSIDAELNRHDLHGAHRAFALLVQLRMWAKEKLVVQTRLFDHECVRMSLKMDFAAFYKYELDSRQELGFPPFSHLVEINIRSTREESALEQAYAVYAQMEKKVPSGIDVMDPQPDIQPKLRDKYRFTIVLKGKSAPGVLAFIKEALKGFKKKSGVVMTVNVDP